MAELITDDGVRLHYVTRGEGSLPVVYLHWMGGSATRWTGLWDALPASRYRHVALDFRGHGGSDKMPSTFNNERLARDVLLLADALGLERFALVGHSFGGKIALKLASLAPKRVMGLVLLGSVGPGRVPLDAGAVEPILARADDVDFVRETFRSWFTVWPRPELDHWANDFARTPGWAHRAVCQTALWTNFSLQAGRIQAPALVIAGANDPVYGPEYQKSAVLPSLANARLLTSDCGHGLVYERPEEIAGWCDDFLRQC